MGRDKPSIHYVQVDALAFSTLLYTTFCRNFQKLFQTEKVSLNTV